jgi:predicted ArsR family transcriptional regulator
MRWDQRFFSTTRGQIVSLLRRASQTVDELAAALGLTDNAIRSHLATLERDGLVAQRGVRRGRGKPALAYELTPEAEVLFPKAHASVLAELVRTLEEHLGTAEAEAVLRTVGRRLAARRAPPEGDLETRLAAAVQLLNELGGLAELETRDGDYYVRGYSCPLGAAAHERPQLCQLAEELVSEVVGAPVQQCCDSGERPRCCFRLSPALEEP